MYPFVFFTDSQADSMPLSFRTDSFPDSMIKKFEFIVEYANKKGADVFCGGDFLDRPNVATAFMVRLIRVWKKLDGFLYIVLGNHDIIGRNLQSHERTSIGILKEVDQAKVFETPIIREGFHIKPIPFTETHTTDQYLSVEKSLIITHNMVLPYSMPFEHILPIDIAPKLKVRGSLILSGHSHCPFDMNIDGVRFINPGSLGRVSREVKEYQRQPQLLNIQLDNGKYTVERVEVPAPNWKTCFVEREIKKQKDVLDLSDLKDLIHSSKAQAFSISQVVKAVAAKKNIPENILSESLKRIEEAEEAFQR